jgi:salicylate 5-hydroxylase large subunit
MRMDETGRHGSLMSLPARDHAGEGEDITRDLAVDASLQLADKRLIEAVKELEGNETLGSCCVFPSVIFLQQINALQIRHIIPKGADGCELVWTHFGFAEDDDEMQQRRIRHGNLFGPGGLVSVDDSEVLAMAQRGFKMAEESGTATVRMGTGGRENTNEGHMATESAIRGLYQYYREVMGL